VLDLIQPPVIATLGGVALEALKLIEYHEFTLKEDAGMVRSWNGRRLVPLYHPSPQVVASQRGLQIQLEHFERLESLLKSRTAEV
jgi:DNA polymerase